MHMYTTTPLPHTLPHTLPPFASPCRNPQCVSAVGAPIVRRPAAEEKGPLVVNNSAVHSDHNGGTSHYFEHLFGVGTGPLTTLLR